MELDHLVPSPEATLAARLAREPLSALETARLGREVLEALEPMHAAGRIHGEVRPACIVLDGGVVSLAGRAHDTDAAEVARYAAPESSGLIDHAVDARADLYSLGVVLYECLAGAPPFAGATLGEAPRLHARAPSLRAEGAVPYALDDAIARLIEKDPRDRYQTIAGPLADLAALEVALARGDAEPELVIGRADRRGTLAPPGFVGREGELGAIEGELERGRVGFGRTLLVESSSGGGKTRLLDEIARRAARHGTLVVRGRAVEDRLSAPWEIFSGLARAGFAAEVTPGPEAFSEQRAYDALAAAFESLAQTPSVMLLDDAQWAPPVLVRLLEQHERRSRRSQLTIVVAFRTEEVDAQHPLRLVVPRATLELAPLGDEALGALAESMAGPLPAEAVRLVAQLAEGNPFFAVATLHGLVESGALVAREEGWVIDRRLGEVHSGSAADALLRRIDLLPAAVSSLLEVGAVLGQQASDQGDARAVSGFELALAAAVLSLDPTEARRAADEARARHLVWEPAPGVLAFSHHKLRDEFVDRLEFEARRALHAKAGEHVAAERPDEVFLIAYHFDAAGEAERAAPFALTATVRARARHAFQLAEACYRIAERGIATSDLGTRSRVARELGEVMNHSSRPAEALVELERALALSGRPEDKAKAYALIGEACYRRGDFAGMSRAGEAGLALLGRKPPGGRLGYALSVIGKVLAQAWHSLFPRLVRRGRREDEARLAMRLYSSLVFANFLVKSPLSAFWAHLSELNLAERYRPTPELARAYLNHGVALGQIPWRKRARAYFERGRSIAEAVDDPAIAGANDTHHAMVLSWGGDHARALELAARAREALRSIGDRIGACACNGPAVIALYRMGRLNETLARCTAYLEEGIDAGDASAIGTAVMTWALAASGHVPRRHLEEARTRCAEPYPRTLYLGAEGLAHLSHGELDAAARTFEQALALIGKQRNGIVADIPLWLTTVRRMQVERTPPFHPNRKRLLRAARAALAACRKWTKICVGTLPHFEREAAHLAALRGKTRAAKEHLARSQAAAESQGAPHELARTKDASGAIARALGWPDAPPEPRRRAPARATLSLIDRFDNLLEAGRGIALALTRERVLEAVKKATVTLLRARACRVSETAPPPEAAIAVAGNSLSFPLWANGQPVALVEVDGGPIEGLFGEEEQRLAAFIAALGGAALENAAGFEQLRLAERGVRELSAGVMRAQEEERRRLALALRDGSSQTLTAALRQLEALGARSAPVARLIESTLEDLRRLSHALRPAALDDLGLAAALRELVESLHGERTAVTLALDPHDLAVPTEVALSAFRIAQAALANALTHASPRTVSVSLTRAGAFAVLEVSDDGAGFDASRPNAGLGLLGMHERAASCGGELVVTSRPGAGTTVRARLSLEAR